MRDCLPLTFSLSSIIFLIGCSASPKDERVVTDTAVKQSDLLASTVDFDHL